MSTESGAVGGGIAVEMTLEDVVRHTREMLAAAQAGEWERVEEMELFRRDHLKRLFGRAPEEERRAAWVLAAETLITLDKELEGLASQAKEEIADSAKKLSASRQAVKVYSQNT